MARLTTLKGNVGRLAPSVGFAEGDRKGYDKQRSGSVFRSWYKTARWQRLRLEVFARDLYQCQQTGVLLIGKEPAPNSPVAHHKTPHRGDPVLFWDKNNLETVSKAWHDSQGQRDDGAA